MCVCGGVLSFFSSFRVNIISILISKTIKKTIEPCFSTCNLVTKHMSEEFSIRARSDEQGFLSNSLKCCKSYIYFDHFL